MYSTFQSKNFISIHKISFFISIHILLLLLLFFYGSVVSFNEIYVMRFNVCVNEISLYDVIY
jgi:hypothetical protein